MEGSNLTALAFQWGRILALTALCHPQPKQVSISMGEDSDPHSLLSSIAQTSLHFNGLGFLPSHLYHPQHKQVSISMGEDTDPHSSLSSIAQTSLHFNRGGFKP